MDVPRIEEVAAALAAEQAARAAAVAGLAARIDGSTDARIDRLVGIMEQQGKQLAELVTHVGMLVQAVALLLGEEAGAAVQDESTEPERVDLDGNSY